MLAQIDRKVLTEILATVEDNYTDRLGWDASADEAYIEGAIMDDVHQELFNGEPPDEFVAPYIYDPEEEPRKTLTKRRRQEIRKFLKSNWQGPGGVILAEEMIDQTITTIIAHHRRQHSTE